VKNPGRQALSRSASGLIAASAGLDERSFQFHVAQ